MYSELVSISCVWHSVAFETVSTSIVLSADRIRPVNPIKILYNVQLLDQKIVHLLFQHLKLS